MRVHILSDIHLERADWKIRRPECDLVLLAGDIGRGMMGLKWARENFEETPIIYIPGNHEFHRHSFHELWREMRDWGESQGIYVLERECMEIDGVRFFGTTLWTDLRLFDDHAATVEVAGDEMSDYDRIRVDGDRPLRPSDTMEMNAKAVQWLEEEAEAGRTEGAVIITHHAPSGCCLGPGRRDDLLSACYASDFDELIGKSRAQLWVYGHTHYSLDKEIRGVRVLSNQRGYPGEDNNGFDPEMVLEIQEASRMGSPG